MSKTNQTPENQRFIELVHQLKKNNIFYSQISVKAKFQKDFISNVLQGRSTAKQIHVDSIIEAFPELEEEPLPDKVKRLDGTVEDLQERFNELEKRYLDKVETNEILRKYIQKIEQEKNDENQ